MNRLRHGQHSQFLRCFCFPIGLCRVRWLSGRCRCRLAELVARNSISKFWDFIHSLAFCLLYVEMNIFFTFSICTKISRLWANLCSYNTKCCLKTLKSWKTKIMLYMDGRLNNKLDKVNWRSPVHNFQWSAILVSLWINKVFSIAKVIRMEGEEVAPTYENTNLREHDQLYLHKFTLQTTSVEDMYVSHFRDDADIKSRCKMKSRLLNSISNFE